MPATPPLSKSHLFEQFRRHEEFSPLPIPCNAEGKDRGTGFEFEFTGIDLETSSGLVARELGGEWRLQTGLSARVTGTSLGVVKVEQDWRWSQYLAGWKNQWAPKWLENAIQCLGWGLGQIASPLTPWELVTEPLSHEQLPILEHLRIEFQKVGAMGSQKRLHHAFGTHLNPEAPSHDASTLLRYLQAFVLLHPHLIRLLDIDPTRRWLTFIDPFPRTYIRRILHPSYMPSLQTLIKDYLATNPTRNRGLDLLPLFAHLEPESRDGLNQNIRELVKARPTFHYRLPDCNFSDPNWRVASTWNSWILVERLANSPEDLRNWSQNWLAEETCKEEPFLRLVGELLENSMRKAPSHTKTTRN